MTDRDRAVLEAMLRLARNSEWDPLEVCFSFAALARATRLDRRQAIAYADDGAYHSAARVLRQLADDVAAHAQRVGAMLSAAAA